MKTTTQTASKRIIENLIADRYGVNALNCDDVVVNWAAHVLAETHGVTVAASEWKRLNARRYRLGVYTTIPDFGSKLWDAYFAKEAA